MKKIIFCFSVGLMLFSCSDKENQENNRYFPLVNGLSGVLYVVDTQTGRVYYFKNGNRYASYRDYVKNAIKE